MREFKGTSGPWSIVETVDHPSNKGEQISFIQTPAIFFDLSAVERPIYNRVQFEADARLIAAAPDLLQALEEAKEIICGLKLSMLVHPDCEEGSEFDDLTSTAQVIEDKIQVVITKALGEGE